jgi:hypothetical protein
MPCGVGEPLVLCEPLVMLLRLYRHTRVCPVAAVHQGYCSKQDLAEYNMDCLCLYCLKLIGAAAEVDGCHCLYWLLAHTSVCISLFVCVFVCRLFCGHVFVRLLHLVFLLKMHHGKQQYAVS